MMSRLAIWFPWILLGLITGWIIIDQNIARESRILASDILRDPICKMEVDEDPELSFVSGDTTYYFCSPVCVEKFSKMPTPAETVGPVAVDKVCSMEVATQSSYSIQFEDDVYFFCTAACRDEFETDPVHYAAVEATPTDHTMRGIPSWMAQWSIAIILVLSFGLFELFPRSQGGAMAARINLLSRPWVRNLVKWPGLQFGLRLITVGIFLIIIAAGLFGHQSAAMNIAPLLTWTIWWVGLVFLILYFGKMWCYVCPWDAIAHWAERLKFWGPRTGGVGLQMKWPRALRNIWFAVLFFVLLTWVELGAGITMIPRATAWVALGMLALAVVSAFLFERKAFCRYACLVGRISGLYALFSSTDLRATDQDACKSCKTMDCYKGNAKGDGCPTFEFPKTMNTSTYCILCTECVKTCPSDAIAVQMRPWGADLAGKGKPRTDEAILALILLSMTGFHGLTMTPRWAEWKEGFMATFGVSEWVSFTTLMIIIMAAPILLFAGLSKISAWWGKPHTTKTFFLEYAYALLPIALFYHLAHNAEHFLMEGPKVMALASDPFGWGWNLFGTAKETFAPLISLEGLWGIQVLLVLIGHLYGLWISSRTTRRLIPERRAAFYSQLPMLAAMVLFSLFSLWLLNQPMEMRLSAM